MDRIDSSPSEQTERVILGRRPLALRFGLTLLALLMGAVVLALAGQWVWSALMLVLLVLASVALYYWVKSK
jgi:hypothetical protein